MFLEAIATGFSLENEMIMGVFVTNHETLNSGTQELVEQSIREVAPLLETV